VRRHEAIFQPCRAYFRLNTAGRHRFPFDYGADLAPIQRLRHSAHRRGRRCGNGHQEEEVMVPVDMEPLIIMIIVGLIAGWLAGLITQGGGFGVIGNIIIGIIGAFIGFYLLSYLNVHIAPGLVGVILTATLGAVILLFIVGLLRR
jgi:uncharacterized membrane protein YeaQ/YmgE (transglycosylase-associated protein family)